MASHRRLRPLVVAALVALAAVVGLALASSPVLATTTQQPPSTTASSTSSPTPPSPAPKKSLLVVGDSVMQGVTAYGGLATLQADLGLPWNPPTFDVAESRSTLVAPGIIQADLQKIAPATYDTVVIALGYNDGGTAAVFESRVKPVLDLLRNVPHVYWLTLREFGQYAGGYQQSNQGLRNMAKLYPNVNLLDWNEFSKTLPESEFTVDGNHLSPDLAKAMAGFLADAVNGRSRYVSPGTTTTTTTTMAPSTTATPASTTANADNGNNDSNAVLIGVIVGAVLVAGFLGAAWAGFRRSRLRRREERRSRWDNLLGITEDDVEAAHRTDEPGTGEDVAAEGTVGQAAGLTDDGDLAAAAGGDPPAGDQATSGSGQVVPASGQVVPASHQPAPAADQSAPAGDEARADTGPDAGVHDPTVD
jgi:lysophospholipase L1-like esterase